MKHFFLSVIIGFYLMVVLADMSIAVDVPAPQFNQPTDLPSAPKYSSPKDGPVPGQNFAPVSEDNNIVECASKALAEKFPFDFFGVFAASPASGSACPRIVLFENSPSPVSFEMCFVLNTISLLKYPLLIGLAVSVIIAI